MRFFVNVLSLSLFEFRILFVDNIHHSLAAHDLAVVSSFLYRCSYFHNALSIILLIFVSEYDSCLAQIVD